ncbi:MAG: electron transfer flavoprotein subunit beta, partial [Deltaproteobacteria bacterium]
MQIVTCIKQVPDTTQVKVDPDTGTLVREGVPFIMNPFDTHALEESLRLKDKYRLRVTAISMGPPSADETLRKALSLGIDEVVLLSDRAFAGADTW